MKSQTLPRFWALYRKLPQSVRQQAAKAYRVWRRNPEAAGLFFKRVGKTRPVYSVRVGEDYRALGLLHGDTVSWFWIGDHDEYERLLKQM
jgi:hypothetical protein